MGKKPAWGLFVALMGLGGVMARLRPAQGAVTSDHGIQILQDVSYTSDSDPSRTLDLYLPPHRAGKLPLVILIHGGGWEAGDKRDFGGPCRDFVRRGYAAASLNYRLSQQAIFPAPVVDCKAAVRWLRAHAPQYGLDPDRFVVGGHSAGGHLAAFLGVTNGDKQFDQGDNLNVRSDVQAVLWFAGVADFVSRVRTPGYESEAAPDSGQSRLIGGAVLQNTDKAMRASPITYVSRRSAPFLFFHGDRDRAVPVAQAREMHAALRKAGVPAELHILPRADHGGPGYFSLAMMGQIDTFLARTLKLGSGWAAALRDGTYRLSPVSAPALVLDAPPAFTGPGVGLAAPNGSHRQAWLFTARSDGFYVVRPADAPTQALTVVGGGTKDGTQVTLARDRGLVSQRWQVARSVIDGTCALAPQCAPNSALDDFGGNATPAAVIDLWSYNAADTHLQWTLTPVSAPMHR